MARERIESTKESDRLRQFAHLVVCAFQDYLVVNDREHPLHDAIVFGSVARGEADSTSDLDLLLVQDNMMFYIKPEIIENLVAQCGLQLVNGSEKAGRIDLFLWTYDQYHYERNELSDVIRKQGISLMCAPAET